MQAAPRRCPSPAVMLSPCASVQGGTLGDSPCAAHTASTTHPPRCWPECPRAATAPHARSPTPARLHAHARSAAHPHACLHPPVHAHTHTCRLGGAGRAAGMAAPTCTAWGEGQEHSASAARQPSPPPVLVAAPCKHTWGAQAPAPPLHGTGEPSTPLGMLPAAAPCSARPWGTHTLLAVPQGTHTPWHAHPRAHTPHCTLTGSRAPTHPSVSWKLTLTLFADPRSSGRGRGERLLERGWRGAGWALGSAAQLQEGFTPCPMGWMPIAPGLGVKGTDAGSPRAGVGFPWVSFPCSFTLQDPCDAPSPALPASLPRAAQRPAAPSLTPGEGVRKLSPSEQSN